MDHCSLWSIIPPLLTITLALIFKNVIFALIVGILSGTLIVAKGNLMLAYTNLIDMVAGSLVDAWNIRILLFCALLGGMVAILSKSGAALAFGEWASSKLKSRTGTLFFTFFFGIIIFIDDYFNSLAVGTAVRPISDRMKISRAKLSYILDSTAAPICIIAPISSWVVTVMSYVKDANGFSKLGDITAFDFFIRMIPYNLYAFMSLALVAVACTSKFDFGPMARSERRALEGQGLMDEERYGKSTVENLSTDTVKARAYDMLIPLFALIVISIVAFPMTTYFQAVGTGEGKYPSMAEAFHGMTIIDAFRNTDASYALFYSIMITLFVVFVYFLARRKMNLNELSDALVSGIKSMVPALVILTLAWTIGGVIKKSPADGGVGLSNFLSQAVVAWHLPFFAVPLCVFVLSCLIAFSTGTSWGTMGIMIPLSMPIAVALGEANGFAAPELLSGSLMVMAATVGGAVYGDHASPISDTTILSATGGGVPLLEHVSTQFPNATFCAVCVGLGYLAGGALVGKNSSAALPLLWGVTLACFVIGLPIMKKLMPGKD